MPPRDSSMPQPWPAVSPTRRTRARAVGRRAEAADDGFAHDGRRREILKSHAIEDVLPGRQVLDQGLRGQVSFGQRIDKVSPDALEAVGRGDLDHIRAGRSARAQIMPESTETSPDWTSWDTTRPVVRAADRRPGDAANPPRARAADAPDVMMRRRVRSLRMRMAICPSFESHGNMATGADNASSIR